MITKDKIKIFF